MNTTIEEYVCRWGVCVCDLLWALCILTRFYLDYLTSTFPNKTLYQFLIYLSYMCTYPTQLKPPDGIVIILFGEDYASYASCEQISFCKIRGFHRGDYEECRLLGRGAV
jgi:hypothetical protein